MTSSKDIMPVRKRRDAEKDLHDLQRRFRAISDRDIRRAARARVLRRAGNVSLFVGVTAITIAIVLHVSPFPPMDTLRHILAGPNCSAARGIGLARAREGEPGYWSGHDADGDGIACEVWPRS